MYFSMFHLVWVGGRIKVFYGGAETVALCSLKKHNCKGHL